MKTGQNIQQGPSLEIVMMRHCDYNRSWQNFPVENLNCCPYHHFLNFRNRLFSFSLTLQFFWHPSLRNSSGMNCSFQVHPQILNWNEIWALTCQLGNIHYVVLKQFFVWLLLCAWCRCSAGSYTQGKIMHYRYIEPLYLSF